MRRITGYGLLVSEETQQGRYWRVTGEREPLASDRLSLLDLKLVERGEIPFLLPVEVETLNEELLLHFRLPIGRRLPEALQQSENPGRAVLELLLALCTRLEDAVRYMLDPGKLVVSPEWIVIGDTPDQVFLLYLPMHGLPEARSLRHQLHQLTVSMLAAVRLPESEWSLLLECMQSSLFELEECRLLILSLLTEAIGSAPLPVRPEPIRASYNDIPTPNPAPNSLLPNPKRQPEGDGGEWGMDGDTLRFSGQLQKLQPATLRILLLTVIVLWLPTVWALTLSTVVLGAAGTMAVSALAFWKKRSAGDRDEELAWSWEEPESADREPARDGYESDIQRGSTVTQSGTGPYSFTWSGSETATTRSRLYQSTPAAQTVFLVQPEPTGPLPEATELLTDETEYLPPPAALEYGNGSKPAQVSIHTIPFVYGRSPEETSWVMEGRGISRKHGAITRQGDRFCVVDYGSRNGTRLNGTLLEPFQDYPVQDGDRITAAETELVFRMKG